MQVGSEKASCEAFLPLASLSSISAAQGQGAGKGGLMASVHLGFHQDVAVLLDGNKI